jgi:hypothetical protein
MVAIASALQGHRVTQADLDTAQETFASASPHA